MSNVSEFHQGQVELRHQGKQINQAWIFILFYLLSNPTIGV